MDRHFILTNGRSGSNYFVQLLNQHPAIVNYGEVLGDWTLPGRRIRPLFRGEGGAGRYLDWMYESRTAFWAGQAVSAASRLRAGRRTHLRARRSVSSLGIKDFWVNLNRYELAGYLSARPEIGLITLVRNNPLARLLSSRTLRETGEVARQEGATPGGQGGIRLDPTSVLADLDVIEGENQAVRRIAAEHAGPVFAIEYEDYFASSRENHTVIENRLQQFLGVEPAQLLSEHRRLRQQPISSAIRNFGEVKEILAGTAFERWLEEPF